MICIDSFQAMETAWKNCVEEGSNELAAPRMINSHTNGQKEADMASNRRVLTKVGACHCKRFVVSQSLDLGSRRLLKKFVFA
jgi:hypothetical protein